MKGYKEFLLEKEVLQYIKNTLTKGFTLAKLLVQNIDFSNGKTITYLPKYVTKESAHQFEVGGKIKINKSKIIHVSLKEDSSLKQPGLTDNLIDVAKFVGKFHKTSSVRIEPVPNTDSWLISIISDFIKTHSDGICIFENALAQANDPWLLKRKTDILTFRNEVYHFLLSKKSLKQNIQNLIRETKVAYPSLIGIMATLNTETIKLNNGEEIEVDILRQIIQKTEKIIIGAYDGEGYIIWEKTKNYA